MQQNYAKTIFVWLISRVARWPVFHRPGPYFTAKLAEVDKWPVLWK